MDQLPRLSVIWISICNIYMSTGFSTNRSSAFTTSHDLCTQNQTEFLNHSAGLWYQPSASGKLTWSLCITSSLSFCSWPTSVFLLFRLWISWKHNRFKLSQHNGPNMHTGIWSVHLLISTKIFTHDTLALCKSCYCRLVMGSAKSFRKSKFYLTCTVSLQHVDICSLNFLFRTTWCFMKALCLNQWIIKEKWECSKNKCQASQKYKSGSMRTKQNDTSSLFIFILVLEHFVSSFFFVKDKWFSKQYSNWHSSFSSIHLLHR